MTIPNKFKFLSDGNELTNTLETIKQNKEVYYLFKYTKSVEKKDQLLGLTEQELIRKLADNIISIL